MVKALAQLLSVRLGFGEVRFAAGRLVVVALLFSVSGMVPCALAEPGQARASDWLPAFPHVPAYRWTHRPCDGCLSLIEQPDWRTMADLLGLHSVQFLMAPDEQRGHAFSYPPKAVVLSPSTIEMEVCAVNFLVGHELVHLAYRHADQDAAALALLARRKATWTGDGDTALAMLNDNFLAALNLAFSWQQQELEADWIGALIAAEASGCTLEQGALGYLDGVDAEGGGVAATHGTLADRIEHLKVFSESARRLAFRRPVETRGN